MKDVLKYQTWIKIFLFNNLIPEYAFRSYRLTRVKIKSKDYKKSRLGTYVYFFQTDISVDGNIHHNEIKLPKRIWKELNLGDNVLVFYRLSWINNDISGGRKLQSVFESLAF